MNYFFIRLIRRLGLIKNINASLVRKVGNDQYTVPVIGGLGFDNLNVTELWMSQLLQKILPLKIGSFIDVGVNIGQTLIKLRLQDSTRDYIGFEPNPKCIYYSEVLIKTNQYSNCRLIPVGLLDKNTVLKLNLYSDTDTDPSASLVDNFRPREKVFKSIFVPVSHFDDLTELLSLEKIAVIKIDVEGAELEVVQSMHNAIKKHRPIMLMEILPCYDSSNAFRINRQTKIEEIFKELDYDILRVIKKDSRTMDRIQRIDSIGIHGILEWCEYVMMPKEITHRFVD
jgi:FkbM family methyltransferase